MTDFENKSPEEIRRLIDEATLMLQNQKKSMRKEVIAQIKELAASINATVEIHEGNKAKRSTSSVSAKYHNPHNPSEVWSGRGLTPLWAKQLLESGLSKEDLLINK